MNELKYETSPYLLQHAANPVHWKAWSDAAFRLAKQQNKPVLVSIGYSTCHWCHVMEHESFEDQTTAQLMNELFINIKVDREEFPDVDHMYMDAVQAMTGSGGWPLHVFLTPDKKPFYGGTYFPPKRAHGRASWQEVLINISQFYAQNQSEVVEQSERLMHHLTSLSKSQAKASIHPLVPEENADATLLAMRNEIMQHADLQHGGFGDAPKFPSTLAIKFLLDYAVLFEDKNALQHACLSLDKMQMGGIHDHLGGGFARYSTDTYWKAPHFEKMLYDNALLMEVFSIAFSITRDEKYKAVVQQIVQWAQREMCSEDFLFYSAQDADSEGVEGKYFTWHAEEIDRLLGEDATLFKKYYQVSDNGNWEHTNILYTTYSAMEAINADEEKILQACKEKLFVARNNRVKPLTDKKVLLGWNALFSKALLRAYLHIGEDAYFELAKKNVDAICGHFASKTFCFYHTSIHGQAKIPAYLDDLAYLMDVLLLMASCSGETKYIDLATTIYSYVMLHFKLAEEHLFRYTNTQFQQVEINKMDNYDGALPSSNSVMCRVIRQLAYIYGDPSMHKVYIAMMQQQLMLCKKHPLSFSVWCAEYLAQNYTPMEVVLVGKSASSAMKMLHAKKYLPHVLFTASNDWSDLFCFRDKYPSEDTLIYVCKNYTCKQPFKDVNIAFAEILSNNL